MNWLLRIGLLLFRKPKLRRWAQIEDKKYSVIKDVEKGHDSLYLSIYNYVSTSLVIYPKDFSKVYWKDVVTAFIKIHDVSTPKTELPLIKRSTGKQNQMDAWDYSGRLWFLYSSILADAFHWSEEDIAKLPVEDALAYIQEVLTEKQLNREFVWSTSEVAYEYDKSTKKSKLHKLPRPYWMMVGTDEKKEVKTVKIPINLLPVGTIIKIEPKDEAKKVEPARDN